MAFLNTWQFRLPSTMRLSVKYLPLLLFLLAPVAIANAQTTPKTRIRVVLTTGSDDLRSGNNAFIRLNLASGSSTPSEVSLGGGFGQNSVVTKCVPFNGKISLSQIGSVTIRHDGSPRRGRPFDTYDNWDLQAISVSLADSRCKPVGNIYNSANDPARNRFVQRFTGNTRQIVLPRQR